MSGVGGGQRVVGRADHAHAIGQGPARELPDGTADEDQHQRDPQRRHARALGEQHAHDVRRRIGERSNDQRAAPTFRRDVDVGAVIEQQSGIVRDAIVGREEFLKYAWEWKEKYGGIILQQLKKLGCSLDWERTSFTMDADYYQSVIKVFVDLYKKGKIYRGKRMINWDVRAKTALSDEEVIHKEVAGKIYHLRYKLDLHNENYITIATVRPETILGDSAICVHPKDTRYKHLVGKFAFVPLINRRIPIIADDYVEMEFGTGALKVTPAHDMNDFVLGQKYNLEVIDTMKDDGTLSEAAGLYIGQDRIDVRKIIIKDLETAGNLEKLEEYTHQVGFSERKQIRSFTNRSSPQ